MNDNRVVSFGDLKRHYHGIKDQIDDAITRVLESGWFVLGKEIEHFEKEFANFLGSVHAIGVGSGTEALHLALVACDLHVGDEIITVPNTAVPTLSAITFAQLMPVFVDVDPESFCMNVQLLEEKITPRTRAIIPVHLFGNACDMDSIMAIANKHHLYVIEDACQAHGTTVKGKMVGTFGQYGCFSFYPSKNLGAFGDGGMVVTNDAHLAEKIYLLRNYGQIERYYHEIKGFNSRLDELQAAILAAQLPHLQQWNSRRREIAALYRQLIHHPLLTLPAEQKDVYQVYHLFVIRSPERDRLREHLAQHGIGTQIHYPVPCHLQHAYEELHLTIGTFPIAESLANEILSLPIYPEMTLDEVEYVARIVNSFE